MNILKRADGKVIGHYNSSAVYIDKEPKHFMILHNGFGLSQDIIDKLNMFGIKWVYFLYHGQTEKVYRISLEKLSSSTKTFVNTVKGVKDLQRFASIKDMELINSGEK